MITFVRTTGGSDLNLASVIEAVKTDEGLVTLFLSDGEIRHATADNWRNAVQYNSELVIPAAPGTILLRHAPGGDAPDVFHMPVVAWLLDRSRHPEPITIEGPPDGDLSMPTILSPTGQVDNIVAHYENYALWHRDLVRRWCDSDGYEMGMGHRRAYHLQNGRVRRGEDLDPYI